VIAQLKAKRSASGAKAHRAWSWIVVVALPLLLSCGLALLVLRASKDLPAFIDGDDYRALSTSLVGCVVAAANVLALVVVLIISRRVRTAMNLWLAVALIASLIDVALTLVATTRYSVGWYAACGFSVVSASVMLG